MFRWSNPILEFPTTLTLIDDMAQFIQSLQFEIDPHSYNTLCFDNPHQGLDYLLNTQAPFSSSNWLDKAGSQSSHSLTVNIKEIQKEVLQPKRFETISIVVVDYMMPGLNGLEVCRSLRNKPFKKILLTGAADEKLATTAFNEGLIDRFIRKDDRNFSHNFTTAIKTLHESFFEDQSSLIKSTLDNILPNESGLRSPVYEKIFKDTLADEEIKEYYLLDMCGSFLCLKYDGSLSIIKVHTRQQLDTYAKHANECNAPETVCRKIENKAFLPFSFDPAVMNDPLLWEKHLYYCENVGSDLYFSYIDEPKAFEKFNGPILSFKDFMTQQTL